MKFHTLTVLLLSIATLGSYAHANSVDVYHIISQSRYMQLPPKDMVCTHVDIKDGKDCKIISMRQDGRVADTGHIPEQAQQQQQMPSPETQRIAELEQQNQALQNQELASRCQSLRANFANLTFGGRIYETNANGERVYLNDQEISSRRQQHEQMINQYCQGL